MPQVENVFSIEGFSIIDSVNEPNTGFVVPTLKPFTDRPGAANSAQALIGRVFGARPQIRGATVIPFNLPPIIGLSTTGGFEYELEGLEGQEPAVMNGAAQGLEANANREPRVSTRASRPIRRAILRSISTSTARRLRRWASA